MGIVLAITFALCCLIAFISYLSTKNLSELTNQESDRGLRFGVSMKVIWSNVTENKYALESVGEDSVYCFILSKSVIGWTVALVTVVIQAWMVSLL